MNTTSPHTTKTRLSFSSEVENHQIAWDNTSLSAFKTCPRYYQYSILEGYSTRNASAHLVFGIAYNDALGQYHKARSEGADYDTATLAAVRFALTTTWDENLGRPWLSDEPTKTRETLVRSVIWYLEHFKDDPLVTKMRRDGTPMIEQSFRLSIDLSSSLTAEQYLLCGHMDRVVDAQSTLNGDYITDFKTTKYSLDQSYFAKYSPNGQVSQYTYSGNIVFPTPVKGVIIDAMQIGVTFTRFQRGIINRTSAQLGEWYADTVYHIRLAEKCVKDDYWPQNDTACDKFAGCAFRHVCGSSPDVRRMQLTNDFHRRVWDPLMVREL